MQNIPKWEIFEISTVSQNIYANPFVDVSVRAVFRLGDRQFTVDGFYDGLQQGKAVWKVRFAPMEEGRWQYRIASNRAELDGRTGGFDCVRAVSHGGLTVSSRFPNWFAREDGTAQMILNEGWYPHPANGFDLVHEDRDFQQPGEDDARSYMDILSRHGINMIVDVSQLYARQESITDPSFRWPWRVVDARHNKIDRDSFNLDYYQRLDRLMAYAKQKGIFFAMELLYDNSVVRPREWSHHPLNRANGGWLDGEHGIGWGAMFDLGNAEHVKYTARYMQYTVARFAAYWNIFWSVGSENGNLIPLPQSLLPYAQQPPERVADWYTYWGHFVARHDPYGRLRTFGDVGKQPLMVTSGENNVILTQDPRNYPPDDTDAYYRTMHDFGLEFWKYGRPVVIGEMTASTNNHYETERRLYWIGFTGGYSMGRADRHFRPTIDGRLTESDKFHISGDPPIYDDVQRLGEFVTRDKVRFWRMRPIDGLLDTHGAMIYCLAAEDEEYVIYFVSGGRATIKLSAASWKWYNPRTGEFSETHMAPAGEQTFVAPDANDWVLHIVADPLSASGM